MNMFQGGFHDVGIATAFGAGVLSFLSPCILPLVPSYLCFLAGSSLDELASHPDAATNRRLLARAVAFVIGFAAVFVALGATASGMGTLIGDHLALLTRIAGAAIVLLGMHMLGVFRIPLLMRQTRFEAQRPLSLAGALVVGLAFGFGWTPCVGPVLASILLIAGTQGSVEHGALLLAAYAAGIGLPFVGTALLVGPFVRRLGRFGRYLGLVEKIMGSVLIGTGVVILAGMMPAIGNWLLDIAPGLGRIG
jgi:cytochrome c-type biogenesis protein